MPHKLMYWLAGVLGLLLLAGCAGAATPVPTPASVPPLGSGNAATQSPPDGPIGDTAVPTAVPTAVTVRGKSLSFSAGETLFNANCALCHGERAAGAESGPPLVHRVYEPGHHPNFAFHNAVQRGVPSHHWQFGDMPPVANLSEEDVNDIICYVRELQQAEGIFVRDAC